MYDFPIRFQSPIALLLLALLPLAWWMARRSVAGLPPVRRALALGLRLTILALIVLALAGLEVRMRSDRVAVYFVLDWSESIPGAPVGKRRRMQEYVTRSSQFGHDDGQRRRGDLVGVIYFGADATCEMPPDDGLPPVQRQSVVEPNGTDIGAALRLALATFPNGVRRRIVLFSDGNQNRGDAMAEVEAARAQGAVVDVVPIKYRHEREIAVQKVILPGSILENVPFEVKALVQSEREADARVVLRRAGRRVAERRVRLRKGRNLVTFPTRARSQDDEFLPSLVAYEVTVDPIDPEDDRITQNNTAAAFSRVQGPPKILYVDGNLGDEGYTPELLPRLARALKLVQGDEVRLDPRGMHDIPGEETLIGYDCIILDNVPAEALEMRRMARIRTLVNDQGVGLVMIGGRQAFGAGNYLRTPIEEALPVDMDLKNKRVLPNGALVIVLHTCEFPKGNYWAKVITNKAIGTLSPLDYVGVLNYTGGMKDPYPWVFKPQLCRNRGRLQRLVDQANPMDMPDFDPTLVKALDGLDAIKAAVKHVIIISDGDPSPPVPRTQRRIRLGVAKGLSISTVTIGAHATPQTMIKLARMGKGRHYQVNNPARLPHIFVKESLVVKKRLFQEETFTPIVTNPNDDYIREVADGGLPPLHGYVRASKKSAAEMPLMAHPEGDDEDQDPILAHWRYGLGRTVAFTSDAKNRWGKDWLGWSRYDAFWGGVVYRTLRDRPSNLRLNTYVEGNRGHIVVQARDEDGNPLSFLELEARVSTPEAEGLPPIRLRQTGVATYEAEFPADLEGGYQISVRARGEGVDASAYGGVVVPASHEMDRLEADVALLTRLADRGGGRVLSEGFQGNDPKADKLFRRDLPAARDYTQLWWWCLALAAMLFPFDVFVRRVMIDWAAIRRRLAARLGREEERPERMDRLMAAKAQATQQRHTPTFVDDLPAGSGIDLGADGARGGAASGGAPSGGAAQSGDGGGGGGRPSQGTAEPVEETYTSRLLKAKKRAADERKRGS